MSISSAPVLGCRDVFDLFSAVFERMEREHHEKRTEVDFPVAGKLVRGRFLGAELPRMLQDAFEVHPAGAEPAALDVWLWDETPGTGIDPGVRLECGLDVPSLRASVVTGTSESGRFVCNMADGWLTLLDLERSRIVGCVLSQERMLHQERARPLEFPLRFWLKAAGLPVLHAGLVAPSGRAGVLIAGPAGAGKSTTALACLDAGMSFLSDDKIGLERTTDGAWVGHLLFRTILAGEDVLAHFPHLSSHARRLDAGVERKAILSAAELFPDRVGDSCRIGAVVLPRLDRSLTAPRLRPARRAEAMIRMLPNCLPIYPTWDATDFARLGDLLQRTPVYWLDVAGSPAQLPRLVLDALA